MVAYSKIRLWHLPGAQEKPPEEEPGKPIRGAGAAIARNMEASLTVPTLTQYFILAMRSHQHECDQPNGASTEAIHYTSHAITLAKRRPVSQCLR